MFQFFILLDLYIFHFSIFVFSIFLLFLFLFQLHFSNAENGKFVEKFLL